MSHFFLLPTAKSLILNPPHWEVWWNSFKYKLLKNREKVSWAPISMVVYLSKRCNFKCEFCFTYDDLNQTGWKEFELTVSGVNDILNSDFGRKTLRVGLLGGEPFINKDIFEILKLVKAKGKITTIVTNASLVKGQTREKLLETYPTMLGVSLYDNNREDVGSLCQWLSCHKKSYWVQSVIEATDLGKMFEILDYASKNRIKNLILSNYNSVRTSDQNKVIYDDNEEFKALSRKIKLRAKKLGIDLTLPQVIQKKLIQRNCQMPFSYVHLDAKGDMGACCFRPPNKKWGNVFTPDSWNNSENQILRKTFLDSKAEPLKECRNCENFSRDLYGV